MIISEAELLEAVEEAEELELEEEFKEFGELVMIVALDWTVVEEDKSVLELVEGELEELQEPELGELLLLITMSIRSSLGYGFSPWLGLFSDNVSIDSIPESSPC